MKLFSQVATYVAPATVSLAFLVANAAFSDETAKTSNPDHASYLLETGTRYFAIDPPEDALALCNRWLSHNKDGKDTVKHGEMLLMRAEIHSTLGQRDLASQDYEAASRSLGNDPRISRGQALLLATTKPNEALRLAEGIIKAHPEFSRGYLLLAQLRMAKGNYEGALVSCNKAITTADATKDVVVKGAALSRRAMVNYNLKRWQQVIDDIDQYLQIQPLPDAKGKLFAVRLEALFNLGKYRLAELTAQAVLDLDSDNDRAAYLWWKACVRQHKYETAWRLARDMAGARPTDGYLLLTSSCNLLGRYEEALEHAHRAVKETPNSAIIAKEMAIAFEGLKQYERADECFARAMDLERHYEVLLARAFFLVNCPNPESRNAPKAAEIAEEASKAPLEVKDWRWSMALAQAKAELGDFSKAITVIEEARKVANLSSEALTEFDAALATFRKPLPYRSVRNFAGHGR